MIKYKPKKRQIFIAMAQKGFTQKKLSEKASLNSSTISIYLNNKRFITPKSALKIANALGCSIEDLFEFEINRKELVKKC